MPTRHHPARQLLLPGVEPPPRPTRPARRSSDRLAALGRDGWVRPDAVAWVLLFVLLSLSVAGALLVRQQIDREAAQRFGFLSDQLVLRMQERLVSQAMVLRNAATYFTREEAPGLTEWRDFVHSAQAVPGAAGMLGIGFIEPVTRHRHDAQARRLERLGLPLSLPAESAGLGDHALVTYLEPQQSLRVATVGIDLLAHPAYRAALELARDGGELALSARLPPLSPGSLGGLVRSERAVTHLMVVPVYGPDAPLERIAQRRAALRGWVFTPYHVGELALTLLADWARYDGGEVRMRVYEGPAVRPTQLVFDSQALAWGQGEPAGWPTGAVSTQRSLQMGGHDWTLVFDPRPPGVARHYGAAWGTLLGGVVLSGLIVGLFRSTSRTRARAVRLANRLTHEMAQQTERLRQSEDRLRSTLDTLPYQLLELDLGGRCHDIRGPSGPSAAPSLPILQGQWLQDALPDEVARTCLQALEEAQQHGHCHGRQVSLELPQGLCWFELSVARKPTQPGEGGRFILLSRDVTALRLAVAEAQTANRSKSRFLAAASHDLRQPLAALSLYLDMLYKRLSPADAVLMRGIRGCVDTLTELLTDLLDVSKLDAGVVEPDPIDLPVQTLLDRVASVHTARAQARNLRLRVRPSPVWTHTDPVLLGRILGNLVSNAIRYTDRGGVLVACRHRGGRCWIEVWDSGIGIAPEQIELVFEEFRQLASVPRRGGSGLGLAIVARTAALLGLQVRVRSWPGRGSMFAIELPPATPLPDEPGTEAEAEAEAETGVQAEAEAGVDSGADSGADHGVDPQAGVRAATPAAIQADADYRNSPRPDTGRRPHQDARPLAASGVRDDSAPIDPAPVAGRPLRAGLRVALVEDNPELLHALRMVLQAEGHAVVAAKGLADLRRQLGDRAPDLVITDYGLAANETGFDVIDGLRARFSPRLPALLVTGETDPETLRRIRARGIAVQFKPLPTQVLLQFVAEVAAAR
ncbi:MAG: response regulator [Rhodoferax sp.]|nr:response regulator [Rhodoferax sp.]